MRDVLAVAAAALWIAGCAAQVGPPEAGGPAAAQAERPASGPEGAAAASARAEGATMHARRVRVPAGAAWLAEPLTARYGEIPASMAVREVLAGRPVRLTFEATAETDPLVSSPPDAVTVQDHLEGICAQADWAYTLSGGAVLVHDMETRVFALAAPPGRSTADVRLRGLKAEGAAGGGGNSLEVALDPYADEIAGFLRGMLGLGGAADAADGRAAPRGSVAVLPSANAVAVTARPHRMRQVEAELARYNASTSLMVRLKVTVYEVDVTGTEDRSLDLAALRSAGVGLGLTVTPASGGESGGGAVRVEFREGNRFGGTQAVLRWLRTAGEAAVAFEDSIEIRNNAVASVDATETRQFLERFSRETQTAGATQFQAPTVEFGELRLGWAIHLQPTVSGDVVTVRIALSRSSLVEEVPYSFDGGNVAGTTHVTDDYNRVTSVSMRDGETRLLTSLTNTATRDARRRVPWLGRFGDGVARARRDRETVMMLTAEVVGVPG